MNRKPQPVQAVISNFSRVIVLSADCRNNLNELPEQAGHWVNFSIAAAKLATFFMVFPGVDYEVYEILHFGGTLRHTLTGSAQALRVRNLVH